MEILVNREPLDFTLQSESSVGDVIDGLADWLEDGKFTITSLGVNDTPYALHDRDSWESIPVGDVTRLDVEALPRAEVDHAAALAVDEYLAILDECLEHERTDALPELAAEIPYVRARLVQFIGGNESIDALFTDPALNEGGLPAPPQRAVVRRQIGTARALLAVRTRELAEPHRELALALGQLSGYADRLIDAPVQLQTGNESAALQTVIALTELLSRVVRLIPLVEANDASASTESDPSRETGSIDLSAVRGFAEELAPVLAELRDAFEIHDTVLMGDLLEYEIAPRLEQTRAFIVGE